MAIAPYQFTDDQVYSEIEAALLETSKKHPAKKKAEAEVF
jgi:hypothetical protein